jgi:cell division protein ZipA
MAIIELLTADLRLALLVVGALLLIGIVVWEIVQRRRASKADAAHQAGPPDVDPLLSDDDSLDDREWAREERVSRSEAPRADAGREEPSLTLPEMHVRDRLVEPTLVDFDAAIAKEPSLGIPVHDSVSLSDPVEAASSATAPVTTQSTESRIDADQDEQVEAPPGASLDQPVPMRLDWPPPDQQRIIGVRVIARNGERFTGVSLRQALLGEGFQHGELEIFHRPVADGRVLLSAASLTKPGNFDLSTMDSGLFLGLNLFAVLPGPLPGRETVDKLLIAGHTLAQRLRGELRDARGEPLTEARLTEMRREAAAGNG